jgi:hypothetical protein
MIIYRSKSGQTVPFSHLQRADCANGVRQLRSSSRGGALSGAGTGCVAKRAAASRIGAVAARDGGAISAHTGVAAGLESHPCLRHTTGKAAARPVGP